MSPDQCAVCGEPVTPPYVVHYRLDAVVCATCPLTNVKGEDITGHCLMWVTQ